MVNIMDVNREKEHLLALKGQSYFVSCSALAQQFGGMLKMSQICCRRTVINRKTGCMVSDNRVISGSDGPFVKSKHFV